MSFTFRPVDVSADAVLLHRWVTDAKASYWMMSDFSVSDVASAYHEISGDPHHDAFVGSLDGEPVFLAERYDPAHVELVGLYDRQPGDIGMHFLCAPATTPVHGFTLSVITAVMTWLFSDPAVRRVVVEPDVRNTAVHRLNAAVGFTVHGPITKPEKEALLSFCTRDQFLGVTA